MADGKSYYELLQHPKWQEKRLRVLEFAGFECESCGTKEVTLTVHHSYYEKGLAPWEYPKESLHCLCKDCHKKAQDTNTLLQRQIGELPLDSIEILLGYACALESSSFPFIRIDVFSDKVAEGVGHCWGLTPKEVIDALQEGEIDGWTLNELSKTKGRLERDQTHQCGNWRMVAGGPVCGECGSFSDSYEAFFEAIMNSGIDPKNAYDIYLDIKKRFPKRP